ncbi:MAG TPA: cytochrome c oxidase subunit 3 [Chromatiaceae bacterium]|jgi:cytochrome c oxidase subunit 3|nr:cytochrome c oxidase subunit 3 [Chromatiaceae bacterium]HIN82216.1 cytochrome c oxidase subunit 3 [Chromatiales bacterium]HIO15191.1 cytochrome c oxidase subunit 3 [Chromatiales bacterium]
MSASNEGYYLPEPSHWPIVGSIGIFLMLGGFANFLHGGSWIIMATGFAVVVYMLFGWFGMVINESQNGKYNAQVDMSFRWGMSWFIFSEVMFFAAFFGTLFYARIFSIPWLGGASNNVMTPELLWQGFEAVWPTNGPGNVGGDYEVMGAWGLPAINTLLLLSSGVTVTIAHWGLKEGNRTKLILGLWATVALGAAFLVCQVLEYGEAYNHMNLTLESGMYGTTFFMLTGFHGLHVTLGATMLLVITLRAMKGHFTHENHFAFEAVAWYWHFVDVVWLGLFIFVYWLV